MEYLPQDIIARKRDGFALSHDSINEWIAAVVTGDVSDAQIAALNMAILLNGMEMDEIAQLTRAMGNSGDVISWLEHNIEGAIVDKHSTGGVGDKTSFLVAPILAACGCYVPMISGRGLGHTGGTLDKLEAIPGFRVNISEDEFIGLVQKNHLAIISANSNMAPADKRIYAVRDVTATVPSEALVTSSILSKKYAAGIKNLVMDIKVGNGAISKDTDTARALAQTIVQTAQLANISCRAVLSDMNEVLGRHAGNSLEILEIIEWYNGKSRDMRLSEVSMELAAQALIGAKQAADVSSAREQVRQVIDDGTAAEYFERMVYGQSGISNILSSYKKYLPKAPVIHDVYSPDFGIITKQNCEQLGMIIVKLNGGRHYTDQVIDYSVGLSHIREVGDFIDAQTPLLSIHAATKEDALKVEADVLSCFEIEEKAKMISPQNPILEIIS